MSTNSSIVPSAKDLILVFPRLAQRAGSFALSQLPDQVDSVWSKIRYGGGSIIADATSTGNSTLAATSSSVGSLAQKTAAAAAAAAAGESDTMGIFSWFSSTIQLESLRGFGSMFAYFSSRWALATFTMSILLNRTHFYASSRHSLRLHWKARFCLYGPVILLLLIQTHLVLQGIHCQTSPTYSLYRYGDIDKRPSINFGGDGGLLYRISSSLLFWQNDETSCKAMNMSIQEGDKFNVMGSFSIIWPFFITICISQFGETLACALQGRQAMAETGMTTFEHSLAFAECEAMISNAIGLGLFNKPTHDGPADTSNTTGGGGPSDSIYLTRSMILARLNVPSEVLLISLISCFSHMSSAILAISGKRHQWRLVNTGIWSTCYLGAFIWSLVRVMQNPEDADDMGILRFPTVCIVGFIPHMLILCGMIICGFIYGLALLLTVISPPPDAPTNLTLSQRFSLAYNNMQANVQFSSASSIRLNWQEDFYANLLKIGFNILTAASEAVYLNETNRVKVHDMTWLEQKRLQEWKAAQRRPVPVELDSSDLSPEIATTEIANPQSGYAHERKPKTKGGKDAGGKGEGGLVMTRRGRWELVVAFLSGVGQVSARTTALLLSKLGIGHRPRWFFRYAAQPTTVRVTARKYRAGRPNALDFWLIDDDGTLTLPKDRNVDVEAETRQRMTAMSDPTLDQAVDDRLYSWWKSGGWWGDVDTSGTYTPIDNDIDDDLTSIISDTASTTGSCESHLSSGQLTPTASEPDPQPNDFSLADLARLLDPGTAEDKEEARLLASHLASPRPLTRSAFRRRQTVQRARILLPSATQEADEEAALEAYMLSRRTKAPSQAAGGQAWASGADGLGAGGPVCVVCQSAPRSVLVWPCGCLSVCDECRVGVAARNFSTCLCCRTQVSAYSRLYVP